MHKVYHREKHGSNVFVTQLPDGTEVPWKPLSIGDFIEYDNLIKSQQYPFAFIENEIFTRCVQSETLVKQINVLPAGVVSAVAHTILLYSGPQTIDELSEAINLNRPIAGELLHMLSSYICQAFPAYKPEEVYALDYSTFVLRVAQAENKLLRTGGVSEPLTFISANSQTEKLEAPKESKVSSQSLLDKYYEQQGVAPTTPKPKAAPGTKQSQTNRTIIKKQDEEEHVLAYTGHEKEDKDILEHQMVQETSLIYQDYLQQSKDGKLTIKTPEQRKAEYLAKAEKVKKEQLLKAKKQKELKEKALQDQTLKEQKKPKRSPDKRRK